MLGAAVRGAAAGVSGDGGVGGSDRRRRRRQQEWRQGRPAGLHMHLERVIDVLRWEACWRGHCAASCVLSRALRVSGELGAARSDAR